MAVTDTAADITGGLDGLNGSHIASITISDNNAIGVTVAQLTSDATAIGKLANANAERRISWRSPTRSRPSSAISAG